MKKLAMFEPRELFGYFEDICAIPHGSGNERGIADYLVAFAKTWGLRHYRDAIHNVVIYKPATPGYEGRPTVILQGHSDMVCEKIAGSVHDFGRDGIDLIVEDGWIRANGTTLGADNGTAVAMMLALLASAEAKHPALECVFTVQEEIGLVGACELDVGVLSGKMLLNLDGGPDFTALVSCAGGCRVDMRRQYSTQLPRGRALRIAIGGLAGGHSGVEIQQGRANAIKLCARLLYAAKGQGTIRLAKLTGGGKDNAIPRDCEACIVVPEADFAEVRAALERFTAQLLDEIAPVETGASITVEQCARPATVICDVDSGAIIDMLFLAPHGVLETDAKAGGFVSASINLGIADSTGAMRLSFMPRSCIDTLMQDTKAKLMLLGSSFGFDVSFAQGYPGWRYAQASPLRDALVRCGRERYGREFAFERTHGGLECGVFVGRIPGLDAAAIGAHATGAHTPEEKLEAASLALNYDLLKNVLQTL